MEANVTCTWPQKLYTLFGKKNITLLLSVKKRRIPNSTWYGMEINLQSELFLIIDISPLFQFFDLPNTRYQHKSISLDSFLCTKHALGCVYFFLSYFHFLGWCWPKTINSSYWETHSNSSLPFERLINIFMIHLEANKSHTKKKKHTLSTLIWFK